jgi:hypothetical protein
MDSKNKQTREEDNLKGEKVGSLTSTERGGRKNKFSSGVVMILIEYRLVNRF